MGDIYTIWMCCGNFDQEDSREEAISMAVAIMNGDSGHNVIAVEGPNGENLMPEAEAESSRLTQEWLKRRQTSPLAIGVIELKAPNGTWLGREPVYGKTERDDKLADQILIYGKDRVRWVPNNGG